MTPLRSTILIVALLGLALPAQATRLAVYPLASQGASAEAMQQIDSTVRTELSRIRDLDVAGEAETRGAVAATKTSCTDDPCLVAFGRALQAGEVLHGEVRALPDSYAVTLRLLDVATGKELGTATESVNRDVEEMVWATRSQVARLKAPERYAGRVVITAPGWTALLDGKPADATLVMQPGSHELKLVQGKNVVERWIDVRFEQTLTATPGKGQIDVAYAPWAPPQKVEFALAPPVKPPEVATPAAGGRPAWLPYAVLGAGVALLLTGVVQQVRASGLRTEVDALRTPGGGIPEAKVAEAQGKLSSISTASTTGWIFLGAGAAATAGGVVLLLLPEPATSRTGPAVALAFSHSF